MNDAFVLGLTGNVADKFIDHHEEYDTNIVGRISSSNGCMAFNRSRHMSPRRMRNSIKSSEMSNEELIEWVKEILSNVPPLTVVDLTPANLLGLHYHILYNTPHSLVTANKVPSATCPMEMFEAFISSGRYAQSCTVMAGNFGPLETLWGYSLPITGILNGSTNFLYSSDKPLSEAHAEGKSLGIFESDSRLDLRGTDAAYKLVILARSAGHTLNLDQVDITPLLPKYILNSKHFPANLKGYDPIWQRKVEAARKKGEVIRYIARFEDGKATVRSERVPLVSPFGCTKETYNTIEWDNGYSLTAKGAGPEITALNALEDIVRINNRRRLSA